ncbi:MAG: hypothetical protein QOK71_08615 [Nitrososphaeraceae archaeon]|nr:hypothetical protein [Nitrososphaeraceae archaeon]
MTIIHDVDYFIINKPPVTFLGTVKTENSIILIIKVIVVLIFVSSAKESPVRIFLKEMIY